MYMYIHVYVKNRFVLSLPLFPKVSEMFNRILKSISSVNYVEILLIYQLEP